jgi:hypothetical protein
MNLSPKKIIFLAVSNYLSAEENEKILKELSELKRMGDVTFLKIISSYFDFNRFKDKPFIKEDIWLYNYLMYEIVKKDNFNLLKIGEEISLKGKLPKKGLIKKYEEEILLPQKKYIDASGKIYFLD